jgi:predicted RNA-binding protein YlxR (DUF448 family)
MKEKNELIRIVRSSEGVMGVDMNGKLPGRGAYICKNLECFDTAVKAKRLERAFRSRIPEDIYKNLRDCLEHQN